MDAEEVEVSLPALLSVAERLCEPSKVPPPQRAEVPADRIKVVTAARVGSRVPGAKRGVPPRVGRTRVMHHDRTGKILSGTPAEQAAEAVALLAERGALASDGPTSPLREPRSADRTRVDVGRSSHRRPHRAGPPAGRAGAARCGIGARGDHWRAGPRVGVRGCGRRVVGCRGGGCCHDLHRRTRRRRRGRRHCRVVSPERPLGRSRTEHGLRPGSARLGWPPPSAEGWSVTPSGSQISRGRTGRRQTGLFRCTCRRHLLHLGGTAGHGPPGRVAASPADRARA